MTLRMGRVNSEGIAYQCLPGCFEVLEYPETCRPRHVFEIPGSFFMYSSDDDPRDPSVFEIEDCPFLLSRKEALEKVADQNARIMRNIRDNLKEFKEPLECGYVAAGFKSRISDWFLFVELRRAPTNWSLHISYRNEQGHHPDGLAGWLSPAVRFLYTIGLHSPAEMDRYRLFGHEKPLRATNKSNAFPGVVASA